jgi:NADH-quinone oxidoreductase subunit L
VTLAVTLVGVFVAWRIYLVGSPSAQRVAAMAPALYRFMANKYYVDEAYDFLFVRPIKWFFQRVDRWFDILTLDGLIDALAGLTRGVALRARAVQSGYVRNYALGILFGAVLLVGYYVLGGH